MNLVGEHQRKVLLNDSYDRYDGLGLSWGILEYIIQSIPSCYCLFTTHYYELTTIAKDHSNVKNIHVSAMSRDNYIAMMYGVHDGPSDKSFGINVAKICNFPPTIIKVRIINCFYLLIGCSKESMGIRSHSKSKFKREI